MKNKEELSKIIKETALEWLYDSSDFVSYWDINSGSCGEFAFSVKEKILDFSGVEMVSTGHFLENKGIESYGENGEFSNHVWLVYNGEHFDIERPNGVKEFLDLPYFQRELKEKELGLKNRDLYFLLTKNPQDFKELICDTLIEKRR